VPLGLGYGCHVLLYTCNGRPGLSQTFRRRLCSDVLSAVNARAVELVVG
jgi:hypothetical protein